MLPGLIDLHAHLQILGHGDYERWDPWVEQNKLLERVSEISAKQLLMAGVTSAADLGGTLKESLAIRGRINSGAIPGPRMWMAGPWITRNLGDYYTGLPNQYFVNTPAEAAKAVDDLANAGVDLIKAYVELKPEHYKAIADAAHKRKLRVHAHVYDPVDVKNAFEAGIDVLRTSARRECPATTPALVNAIAAKGTPVVVTGGPPGVPLPRDGRLPRASSHDPQLRGDFGPADLEARSQTPRSTSFQAPVVLSATDQEMRLAKPRSRSGSSSNCRDGHGDRLRHPDELHTEALWREIKAHVDMGMSAQRHRSGHPSARSRRSSGEGKDWEPSSRASSPT